MFYDNFVLGARTLLCMEEPHLIKTALWLLRVSSDTTNYLQVQHSLQNCRFCLNISKHDVDIDNFMIIDHQIRMILLRNKKEILDRPKAKTEARPCHDY